MTGTVRGILYVRKTDRRVAVHRTKQRQDRHVEDLLTFSNKDSQMKIRSEKNIKRGTTRGITLHHLYDDTV